MPLVSKVIASRFLSLLSHPQTPPTFIKLDKPFFSNKKEDLEYEIEMNRRAKEYDAALIQYKKAIEIFRQTDEKTLNPIQRFLLNANQNARSIDLEVFVKNLISLLANAFNHLRVANVYSLGEAEKDDQKALVQMHESILKGLNAFLKIRSEIIKGNKLGLTDLDDIYDFGKITINIEGEKSFNYVLHLIDALNILILLKRHPFMDKQLLKQSLTTVLKIPVFAMVPKELEKSDILQIIVLTAEKFLNKALEQIDEYFKKRYEPYIKEVATCYNYLQAEMPADNVKKLLEIQKKLDALKFPVIETALGQYAVPMYTAEQLKKGLGGAGHGPSEIADEKSQMSSTTVISQSVAESPVSPDSSLVISQSVSKTPSSPGSPLSPK